MIDIARGRSAFKQMAREYLVLFAIMILLVITAVVEPKFLSAANLTNILRQFGPLSLVSLGMTFVIIGGFIDLSVAGIMSLVAVTTVVLIKPLGQAGALLTGLAMGAVMGYINSLLLLGSGATTSAEALFITYGMSTVYSALALIVVGGATQRLSRIEGRSISIFDAIGRGGWGPISVSFMIFLFCLVILYIFQSKTYIGRSISLTGGNKTAARLSGIPVDKSIRVIYMISGLMAAMAAIVLFSRTTTASPADGRSYETNAILSVVVGGTTLKGGKGSVLRTVLGVLLVTLLSNCLNLLGVSTYMQSVLKGAILVVAIWLDNLKER
ncbi:ribose ABC transporter permease [Clostridia bacterium]|nr:ribose ABC transporter permease [Clostridia bacterium]